MYSLNQIKRQNAKKLGYIVVDEHGFKRTNLGNSEAFHLAKRVKTAWLLVNKIVKVTVLFQDGSSVATL